MPVPVPSMACRGAACAMCTWFSFFVLAIVVTNHSAGSHSGGGVGDVVTMSFWRVVHRRPFLLPASFLSFSVIPSPPPFPVVEWRGKKKEKIKKHIYIYILDRSACFSAVLQRYVLLPFLFLAIRTLAFCSLESLDFDLYAYIYIFSLLIHFYGFR